MSYISDLKCVNISITFAAIIKVLLQLLLLTTVSYTTTHIILYSQMYCEHNSYKYAHTHKYKCAQEGGCLTDLTLKDIMLFK